jgi:hypothetical protein
MSIISAGGAVVGAGAAAGGYQIERSLRFNSADDAYLNRTFGSPTNNKMWTYSVWMKRSAFAANQTIMSSNVDGTDYWDMRFNTSDQIFIQNRVGGSNLLLANTTAVYRDPSAWYHIVFVFDSNNGTAANRNLLYVNGVNFALSANSGSSDASAWNVNSVQHNIGVSRTADGSGTIWAEFNGYETEINFIDGSALDPTSFGEFNSDTGVWQPKAYTGSYGTNGFYLNFSDNTSTTTLGDDLSGNGNDWTTNNFSVTAGAGNDSLVDTPTPYGTDTGVGGEVRGNYATLNPLDKSSRITLTNGNLDGAGDSSGSWGLSRSTFSFPSSGKWYWEVRLNSTGSASNPGFFGAGMVNSGTSLTLDFAPSSWPNAYVLLLNGDLYVNNSSTIGYGSSFSVGDICIVAFDRDNSKIYFGRNGTWFDSGNPATETNPAASSISTSLQFFPSISSVNETSGSFNFGQRPFAYTAPSGFKALCTQNLPESEATIVDGGEYFNTVLWTGTGSGQSITGMGFQPDWLWFKSRNNANDHALMDVVRGATKGLSSNSTAAEVTSSAGQDLVSFDADGFTTGTPTNYSSLGSNGFTIVTWGWKANGSGVSNTDGDIASTVSANTDSGFSIVTYTGTNVTGATVGHGLGTTPSMIIIKQRNVLRAWIVYHISIGNTGYIQLHSSDAEDKPNSTMFNNAGPSLTTFTIGSSAAVNESGGTYVAYCFAAIPGYSAFGSYTGNGSADGPFVYTGFRPAFVLVKASSAATDWYIYDTSRDTYNVATLELNPNLAAAEQNGTYGSMDINSNGFKLRFATGEVNASGATYIYYAVAENPFKYSLAR